MNLLLNANNQHWVGGSMQMQALIFLAIILAGNFIPTIIAYKRQKRNKRVILTLNIITTLLIILSIVAASDGGNAFGIALVITVIVWIVTFIWSILYEKK